MPDRGVEGVAPLERHGDHHQDRGHHGEADLGRSWHSVCTTSCPAAEAANPPIASTAL